jgi:hypothetical protein
MMADLCLVLMLDASQSMDAAEFKLQAEATAAALVNPDIVGRITGGPTGRVHLLVAEWSGQQFVIVPWTTVASRDDAEAVASEIVTWTRRQSSYTRLGDAVAFAHVRMLEAPPCTRRAVDISSDGRNNQGPEPEPIVAALYETGVEINAIVVEGELGVVDYYKATVPGFVLVATWDTYAQAIKAKLSLEIAGIAPFPPPQRAQDRDWRWSGGTTPATEFWSIGAQHDGRPDPRCNCHHWTETGREPVPVPDSLFLLSVGLMLLGVIGWSWRRR